MTLGTADHLAYIREHFPGLTIDHHELNTDGLINDVMIVNGDRVFRFPKNEWAVASLAKEARILELVRQHVDMPVPSFDYRAHDCVAYDLIPGVALRRDMILRLPGREQDQLAKTLARFLRQLHGIPLGEVRRQAIRDSDAVRQQSDWLTLYADVQSELFPLMMQHTRAWVRQHFAPIVQDENWMRHQPALIHADLGPYHALYDADVGRINGVIDFGTAGVGDPAADFACLLYHYGEGFLRRMGQFYPEIEPAVDRARFWAGTLEVQWALAGVRSRDLSWLAAHIGSARDALPVGSPW